VLYRTPQTPVKEVLIELLGPIDDQAVREGSISLCPSPKRAVEPLTDKDLSKTLCDVGVASGSVLTLGRTRRKPERL
jgi:hypothetical protein